jgi:exo-beta-1,3-glucanase (GH17 family)
LKRYNGEISYLWIDNEIDDYLYKHKDEINDYSEFYKHIYLAVKQKYPKIKIGTISTYHDAKNNKALDIIKKVGGKGDVLGFSLYPQMMKNSKPADVEKFFREMSSLADDAGLKFAITETGWSTAGFGGSEAKQAQYITELFKAYKKHKNEMEFLGLFNLYDFPKSVNKAIASNMGAGNKKFIKFQGSLGLAYNNGESKQAWQTFLSEMKNW